MERPAPSRDHQDHDSRKQQTRQIRFVEDHLTTQYASVFNIAPGSEEFVLVFGNPSIDPSVIRIESKIAVSPKTAKRLALTLANLIQRHEAANGVVEAGTGRREWKKVPVREDRSTSKNQKRGQN